MATKKYNAVIIGAGKIASGYDTPKSKAVLTHAHALTNNPRTQLVGISDIDSVRGAVEAKKWKTSFFADTHDMLRALTPEIIVIATPNATHTEMLALALSHNPKVIIMEKPVVHEQSAMKAIRALSKKTTVPVVVNFRRRFDGVVSEIRGALLKGKYGSILSASALYSKGVVHNGSHMIDLARYLFGEMTSSKMHFSVDDFSAGEPTLGGVATFERCPQFYLMTGDERSFYVFEMSIVTEKCRIRFVDEGRVVLFEEVVKDTVYPDDRVLGKAKSKPTKLAESMSRMVEHAIRVADGKERSHSSLADALETQATCYKLLSSFKK